MSDENKLFFLQRLNAQAEEAETQGLISIAQHLSSQLEKIGSVDVDSLKKELNRDGVKSELITSCWNVFAKMALQKDAKFNSYEVHENFEKIANDTIDSMLKLLK